MLPINQVSLICPRNDLESDCILGIAARLQLDIREVSGDWGVTLGEALRQHPDLDSLRRYVIVVELPGAAGRDLLTLAGKQIHVVDHHGPASDDGPMASSLEQFAALVGYELTTAEYEVAIADRDFYPGLTRAGVPLVRAQALRRQEHEIRGTADLLEEARTFVAVNARQLGQLTLYFAPERLAKVLLDAAQEPRAEDYTAAANQRRPVPLPQVLAVFHAERDPACIRAVRFAGAAAARVALSTLLTDAELGNSLSLWLGGGDLGCFFGADARKGHPAPAFDRLMSRVFSLIGGTSRPVLHYGCTFLLPLDLHESSELKTKPAKRADRFFKTLVHKEQAGDIRRHRLAVVSPGSLSTDGDHERRCETQAHLYFLPLLRDLLFDAHERRPTSPGDPDTPSIQRWRLAPDALDGLSWRLDGPRGDAPGPAAKVCDVSLYRYYNDLYLLAIRVESMDNPQRIDGAEALACDHDRWWRPLFDTPAEVFARIERLRLDHWLRFTKHARILYPSFIEQMEEEKFDAQTLLRHAEAIERFPFGADVSPIVLYLLAQFLADDPQQPAEVQRLAHLLRLQNLSEERMFVNVAYGLAGPAPGAPVDRQEADRLFNLALYVDRESDSFQSVGGYAYDPDYTRELARTQRLDRWRALGTYLGFCPYANAYLGFGGFFANVIAAEHVPYHYERMLILALFHQLTLRNYNRRITHATRLLIQPEGRDPGSDFRELRRDFIEFTNCHWFREVTLAIQGKEVFAKQVAVLDIAPEYAEVKDEMERADEYVQSLRERSLNEGMLTAGLIAVLLTVVTLLLPLIEYDQAGQYQWWCLLVSGAALLVGFAYHRLRRVNPYRPARRSRV